MRRTALGAVATAALVGGLLTAVPAQGEPAEPDDRRLPRGDSGLEVYTGTASPRQLDALVTVGVDRNEVSTGQTRRGATRVEAILTAEQAKALAAEGVDLRVKQVDGRPASTAMARQAAQGDGVYRSYSEPGGIRDELVRTTRNHPRLTKLVDMGSSVQGQEILAVKVTRNARNLRDGARPAVLYTGTQHAREWITPEMTRRLMHHVLDKYGESTRITRLLDSTELWFVPVANPDGYDFTFTEGNRLWRKNLRDVNGDGQITSGDGIDPNRNFPYKWGWDNEGSSPEPSSETYRGRAPASEPETRALLRLMRRVDFQFHVNYHSAAELLLYGTGWQVSTPTPDDVVYEALAGTDDNSAVPGYDPDLSAELYTTNGETTEHVHKAFDTLAYTPEMTTCQTVSASDPDDEWEPEDCVSGFNFPDDEGLIQAEFRKNIPFALSMASSASNPDDPKSSVGLDAAPFVTDPFDVSYARTQPVAVTAKRSIDGLQLNYRINGGDRARVPATESAGGERYGDDGEVYYAEYRGTVRGARPGDSVRVWFTGTDPDEGGRVASDRFTYKVHPRIGGDVLVLAAEDVTGDSPPQAAAGGGARYADDFRRRLRKAGYEPNTYDVDRMGRTAPHHLGVLSHYDAVVWETGNDIITRDFGQPAGTSAELTLDLELAVRDYLNEGGKLLHTGKYAQFAQAADGVYFYNPFEEEQGECTTYAEYPCLPLLNDFQQYWLGAFNYVSGGGQDADGNPYDVAGSQGAFAGFDGRLNGGTSPDNQDHTASLLTTSSFLPPAEFPQFASAAPLEWARPGGAPYDPFTGEWYVYSQRADVSYKRLTRTVDLSDATSGALEFRTSYDTEINWDYVFVEARPVGTDDWTTLPDANGHTAQGTGDSCPANWNTLHPQLDHYQGPQCEPQGTTGEWHAATGNSGGWQEWSVDLSEYAGDEVEVHISYASDFAVQGLGTFVDDPRVLADGQEVASTSFETGLDGWTVSGPPPGSDQNANDWERSQSAFDEGAGVTTDDTVFVGFGAEGLRTRSMRKDFVERSMAHLLGGG